MFRLPPISTEDHPMLGVALFAIGALLVGLAYYSPNAPLPESFSLFEGIHGNVISSLVLGHIFAFSGVFLVVLGCRKLNRVRGRDGGSR